MGCAPQKSGPSDPSSYGRESGGVLLLERARVEPLDEGLDGTLQLEFDEAAGTLLQDQTVGARDWERTAPGGGYAAPLEFIATSTSTGLLLGAELVVDGRSVALERRIKDARPASGERRDVGVARERELIVYTSTGARPGEARYLERRILRDVAGRVQLAGVTGLGFAVPRHHRIEFELPAGPAGTAVLQLAELRDEQAPSGWTLVAGEPRSVEGLLELRLKASSAPRKIVLEYRGTGTFGAVFEPRLLPADEAEPEGRGDVLLFVADTFRADNMRAYAGRPGGVDGGLTPFLDGLVAERAAWFPNAWSPASWTLPAHGSIFTGLYPPEHTALRSNSRLPGGLELLAERFSAAGYRTVAVTDGAYLSPQFGLDRGFELFSEGPTGMARTRRLMNEALDDLDPRPLFLFVQSYRTHSPFVADAVARSEVEPWLATPLGEATFDELHDGLTKNPERPDLKLPRPLSAVQRLADLYRAGAHDFDGEFELVWADLEARGFFEHGLFGFTSDHGEAFAERGEYGHGTSLEESQTRIPLFFVGADVTPGALESPASLVDLGTTLGSWAGLGSGPLGHGRDLLDPEGEAEAVFGYQGFPSGRVGERAAWTRSAKWVQRPGEAGALRFELPIDPAQDAGEPAELMPFAAQVAEFERERAEPVAVGSLGDEARARLEALGYLTADLDAED